MTGPVPKFVRRRRVADRLRAAADLLATDGWIQGEDDQGRHCISGALKTVIDDRDDYWTAYGAVREHLGKHVPWWNAEPTWWNDEPDRTAEQVIAVLRETAAEQDAYAAALEAESRPAGELP